MVELYWFECPVCEYDSGEAGGQLVPRGEHLCPLCAADNGRDVAMRLLPVTTRAFAKREATMGDAAERVRNRGKR